MSWPQWPGNMAGMPPNMTGMGMPGVNAAGVMNASAGAATATLPIQYTPEQWQQLQQQNWQQWAQWQQQYQQWHQQYGAEYQKMTAMTGVAGATVPSMLTMQTQVAQELKPPLPVDPAKPPQPPHTASLMQQPPLPSLMQQPPPPIQPQDSSQRKVSSIGYSTIKSTPPTFTSAPPPTANQTTVTPSMSQMWKGQPNLSQPPPNFTPSAKRPNNQPEQSDAKRNKTDQTVTTPEELSETEKKFMKQFAEWEAQFNKWKEQNQDHPDKAQYKEYEKKWEAWRNQLLERREQMRRKRLGLLVSQPEVKITPKTIATQSSINKPPPIKLIINKEPKSDFAIFSQTDKTNLTMKNSTETKQDLFTSNTSGIPGLDLVDSKIPEEKLKVNESTKTPFLSKSVDLEALSKNINSILGDKKLLSMLSLVTQNPSLGLNKPTPSFEPPSEPVNDEISRNSFNQDDESKSQFSRDAWKDNNFDKEKKTLPDSDYRDNFHNKRKNQEFDREIDRNYNKCPNSSFDTFTNNKTETQSSFNEDNYNWSQTDRGNKRPFTTDHDDRKDYNTDFHRTSNSSDFNRSDFDHSGHDFNKSGSTEFNKSNASNNFNRTNNDFNRTASNDLNRSTNNDFNRSSINDFSRSSNNDFNRSTSNDFNRSSSNDFNNQSNDRSVKGDFNRPTRFDNGKEDFAWKSKDDCDNYNPPTKLHRGDDYDDIDMKPRTDGFNKAPVKFFEPFEYPPAPSFEPPPSNDSNHSFGRAPDTYDNNPVDCGIGESLEDILSIEKVVNYDHKPKKPIIPEVNVDPPYLFDYRHKPVNRIPLPDRPKWLYETLSNIKEFEPSIGKPSITNYPRFAQVERFDYRSGSAFAYPEESSFYRRPYDDRYPERRFDEYYRGHRREPEIDTYHRNIDYERDRFRRRSRSKEYEREPRRVEVRDRKEQDKIELNKTDQIKTVSKGNALDEILSGPGRFKRPSRVVIILRGPPGSGKTFLAKTIKDKEVENGGSAPRILSLDDYFMVEHEKDIIEDGKKVTVKEMLYEYEACMEDSYRASLLKSFKKTITDGYFPFIIVDNVNDKTKYFEEMWSFAKQNGFEVYIVQLELDVQACSKRNIHQRSEEEISNIVSGWESTPSHFAALNPTNLLQAASIPEVEMEEINSPNDDFDDEDENVEEQACSSSKWDNFECSINNLAKLDGISKPLRATGTMEDFLQLDEWTPTKSSKPGQKRVRWADLEERKEQEKMRAIGFVVGQTDWDRMMDPTQGSSALTQTKYIERVGRIRHF